MSVFWTEGQLVPLVSHENVFVKLLPFHFNHLYLQQHVQSLLHSTSTLALLASLHNRYISYKYILMACITFFWFIFYIFYHYSEMCVLDPAVARCSSCTSGIKPLSYNTSRANKWKAVSGSDSPKVEFQHSPPAFSVVLFILPTHAAPVLLLPPAGTELDCRTGQAGCFPAMFTVKDLQTLSQHLPLLLL